MAEPVISLQLNEGTEGSPVWADIDTAARWVGPDSADSALTDPFIAPVLDATDHFFDNAANPDDGELWNEKAGTDTQCVVAGRAIDQNCLRALEDGTDVTADPPEFTAYDDATDGGNRTAPAVWLLVGTAGSSSISIMRGVETTTGDPAAGWGTQVHDSNPGGGTSGEELQGDTEKVTCATFLAASGNKLFQLAACAPHDSTAGLTAFIYQLQYTYV